MIIYLFLKDINHTLFPFFPPSLSPYIRAAERTDRGMAFKGKSNRLGDIKKKKGKPRGRKWVEMQKRKEALKW